MDLILCDRCFVKLLSQRNIRVALSIDRVNQAGAGRWLDDPNFKLMNAAVQVIGWSLSSQGCWRNLSCNIHLRPSFLLVSWCLSSVEFVRLAHVACSVVCIREWAVKKKRSGLQSLQLNWGEVGPGSICGDMGTWVWTMMTSRETLCKNCWSLAQAMAVAFEACLVWAKFEATAAAA